MNQIENIFADSANFIIAKFHQTQFMGLLPDT